MSSLKFQYARKMLPMKRTEGLGSGLEKRMVKLKSLVSELYKDERIQGHGPYLREARGYAERMIHIAQTYGDRHAPTMELMNYWFDDKKIIKKIFNVLIPRYKTSDGNITNLWNLPNKSWPVATQICILEMKGNPWPKITPHSNVNKKKCLVNVLLNQARLEVANS